MKQVIKHIDRKFINREVVKVSAPVIETEEQPKNKRNKTKKMTQETLDVLESQMREINGNVKVKYVKKEDGLIERAEHQKVIIMEDNREVLTD